MSDCELLDLDGVSYFKELKRKAVEKGIPLRGVFELTPRCNFNCKMCYVHLNEKQIQMQGRELSNEEWLTIAKQAKRMGLLSVVLTGGEVFVRPHFRELYEALSEMGFLIHIMTNASLINEQVIEWLNERPPYTVRITLYGSNDEIYEKVCGIKKGFTKVNKAIDLMHKHNILVNARSTVIRENYDDLKNMYQYAYEKGLPFKHTFGVVKPVRGATGDISTRVNMKDAPFELLREQVIKNDQIGKVRYIHHDRYIEDCGSYRTAFSVTWDGKMNFCPFMQEPSINVIEKGFEQGWKELLEYEESIRKPKECKNCKYEGYCLRCPGILSAESGHPDSISREYCEQSKYLYSIYN